MSQLKANQFPVRTFGGPTALFEYGGLRFLTDPTFDGPGDYATPGGPTLVKTAPSTTTPADLGPIDVVLLSHDEHADNLDASGRALLADVPLTLTTPGGGKRLGAKAKGLADWESAVRTPHWYGSVAREHTQESADGYGDDTAFDAESEEEESHGEGCVPSRAGPRLANDRDVRFVLMVGDLDGRGAAPGVHAAAHPVQVRVRIVPNLPPRTRALPTLSAFTVMPFRGRYHWRYTLSAPMAPNAMLPAPKEGPTSRITSARLHSPWIPTASDRAKWNRPTANAQIFRLRFRRSSADLVKARAVTRVEPSTASASSVHIVSAALTASTNRATAASLTSSTRCTAGAVPAGAVSSTVTARPSERMRRIARRGIRSSSVARRNTSASSSNWSRVPPELRRTGIGDTIDMCLIVWARRG
ncbi:hypothetical protein SGLAM104S_04056 [Streptomyces glaucescens]